MLEINNYIDIIDKIKLNDLIISFNYTNKNNSNINDQNVDSSWENSSWVVTGWGDADWGTSEPVNNDWGTSATLSWNTPNSNNDT